MVVNFDQQFLNKHMRSLTLRTYWKFVNQNLFSAVNWGPIPRLDFKRAQGMFGGPNGSYGSYSMSPNVTALDFKNDRERQSGE